MNISQSSKIIGLEGYEPSQPWSAPAAAAQLNMVLMNEIPSFPTLQEVDNKFDGLPESGNPFINWDVITPVGPIQNGILVRLTSIKRKAAMVADLIRSGDKLYFIAYSHERSQEQNEWKQVRLDF
jgi:hypothetical protein